jgi:hypothetical protein
MAILMCDDDMTDVDCRDDAEDRELIRIVDGMVGRVNGRFGLTDYCPVNYVKAILTVRKGLDKGPLSCAHRRGMSAG